MKQIEDLIAISRKFGQDSRFVIAGGGNTSYKDENRLWVKASGHALATITEDGFAVLDRALLNEMGEKAYNEDTAIREEQVKNDLSVACITKDKGLQWRHPCTTAWDSPSWFTSTLPLSTA